MIAKTGPSPAGRHPAEDIDGCSPLFSQAEKNMWAAVLLQSIDWLKDPTQPAAVRAYSGGNKSPNQAQANKWAAQNARDSERRFWGPEGSAREICDLAGLPYESMKERLIDDGFLEK